MWRVSCAICRPPRCRRSRGEWTVFRLASLSGGAIAATLGASRTPARWLQRSDTRPGPLVERQGRNEQGRTPHHHPPLTMTTLEAAAEFGIFDTKEATAFCKQHDLEFKDALNELGDIAFDAVTLCEWIGY